MEDQEENGHTETKIERQTPVEDENLLQFLDSLDGYLTLLDSLASTLRQGWLELASARHSMGASRINGALLDLKVHSAATSLQVSELNVNSMKLRPCFTLHKWACTDNGDCASGEEKSISQLRHRNNSLLSEEKASARNATAFIPDDQIQKQRKNSLSVFGALVSPKLRSAQLSFETALETLVEIANLRSTILYMFEQVHKNLEDTTGS